MSENKPNTPNTPTDPSVGIFHGDNAPTPGYRPPTPPPKTTKKN
jgi:hypothetical protein|nr:MAG TPA: hypothetical protein [Caudoviricetes sp.]